MAKIRRIIRKLKPPRYQPLDEQLWPVIVALVVLGGFTLGALANYLSFDDPRWYANAITWIVVAVLGFGGAAVAVTLIDNRTFRHRMQLAVLLGLLVHAVLLVLSIELEIFGPAIDQFLARRELLEQRQPVTVPDYVAPSRHNRLRQDLTRPVETETPQLEPEPVERQTSEPETSPPEPQPTPVPEPEQTVQPNLVKQQLSDQETPRFSDQESRLTRRMSSARTPPVTSAAAAVAAQQPAPAAAASRLQAQDSGWERRQTPAPVARQATLQDPAVSEVQPEANVARRTPQQAPQAESPATPTLERQIARPIQVPRTAVDLAGNPAEARRTRPEEIQPQTTAAARQATASPDRPQQPAEPLPEVERSAAQAPQSRQLPTPPQPELARSPVSVPNQRTRVTIRPNVTTATRAVSPADATTPTPPPATAAALATAVPRAATRPPTPTDQAANPALETPASIPAVTQPAVARRQVDASSAELAAAAATAPTVPRRSASTPQIAARTSAETASTETPAAAAASPAATAVATRADRQTAASAPGAAPSSAEPADAAVDAVAAGASPAAARRPRGEQAPTLAASPLASPARRQDVTSPPHLTTIAADVAAPPAAVQAASDQPRPSLATVARQPAADPAATRSQPSLEVQAAGTATQMGRPAPRPWQPSDAPSIAPDAPPAPTVARAVASTPLAASPENVESPAVAEAARGVGSPSAEPARMALTKAVTGTAGVGAGRNLDRARPAADSPAMIASAAARRVQATQETPLGSALSPQASAVVRRAVAGNRVPTASLPARVDAEDALVAGARQPETLAASASAALTRADAAAPAGPVTGTVGTTEVDLGPSRAVSEAQTGRGSGGGQPKLNFDTDTPRMARRSLVGGAPQAALTSPSVAQVPTAPAADGGGQPRIPQAELLPTAVARTDAGGFSPSSGGPAQSVERGPPTEVSQAPAPDQPALARADLSQAVPDLPASGGGSDEDEEERRRRLARAAAQALAQTTPTTAEGIEAPADAVASARQALAALGAAVERSPAAARPAPLADNPNTDAAPTAPSALASSALSRRSDVLPDVPPGPALASAGGPAVARAERSSPTPDTSTAAAPAGQPADAVAGVQGEPLTAAAASGLARVETAQPVARSVPAGSAIEAGPPADAPATYQRTEAAETAIGNPQPGGGTAAPDRAAIGPSLAIDLQADAVSLAAAPQSGGADDGRPLAAASGDARNLPAGRIAPPNSVPIGAMAGAAAIDVAVAAAPGVAAGIRLTSPATSAGPELGQPVDLGAPRKRADRAVPPSGSVQVAMVDAPRRGTFETDEQTDHSPGDGLHRLALARQATEGGLTVNLDAVEGPGGLDAGTSVEVGLNDRRAVRDSVHVSLQTARFVRHQVGGPLATSTAAIVPTDAFRRRPRNAGGGWTPGLGSPPPLTEQTIDLGLDFLVRQQLADGSWSLQSIPGEQASLVSDTAATALALLAFQGAGYNHREHQYADVVRGGIEYLLKSQKTDGDLFLPMDELSNQSVWLYSHALATLAVCEAYGMTQDPQLEEPAQKALEFIVASQHSERGGWRYAPQVGSDTSVSGWMMMALKSGELAGLAVPEQVYANIRQWLDRSQASDREPHLYRYNPLAPNTPEQGHGRLPTKTMTSVGLLMRLYLGWQRDNPNMIRGAQYLAENLPTLGTRSNPQRDTYYWYYATQVMFHMGGDYWKAWNESLHPLLTETQLKRGPLAGSWEPRGPVPDRWAPHAGRLYVTTMNILSLEVYYRHLPLYEDTLR
jgi:hypothetical protein